MSDSTEYRNPYNGVIYKDSKIIDNCLNGVDLKADLVPCAAVEMIGDLTNIYPGISHSKTEVDGVWYWKKIKEEDK